ncbi:MAG TPA: hypothetical protein VF200_02350 [Woeseiaceae bacterium]
MDFVHRHNLVDPEAVPQERRYGIRVTLPPHDTFRRLLGDDWERLHWYPTREERDEAFRHLAIRHGYYRKTDTPTQILEKIER